jgi:hypothetical protein
MSSLITSRLKERSTHFLWKNLLLASGLIAILAVVIVAKIAATRQPQSTPIKIVSPRPEETRVNENFRHFPTLSTRPAPTIGFCSVPTTLPRNTPLGNYSPLICFQHSGLDLEKYTAKVFLLETGSFFCASGQWCGSSFILDNQAGNNSSGTTTLTQVMDVFDYPNFLWVIDLYNQSNVRVASVTQPATSTSNRAPALSPIGSKVVSLGQSLNFVLSASDTENDAITFTAQSLPPGATLSATGEFHWQPSALGTFSSIAFIATQSGAIPLSDAELINIQVGAPPPAGELAFSKGSYTTGESGPAVLIVTRTNGSSGAVTVAYSTASGTAISDSDFAGVSTGTLSFAAGEASKAIRVPILNNATVEPNETFQVALSAPTGGATLGALSQATVTIVDDDTPQLAGQWGNVNPWPTVPIHMHVLPNGKVMFWDRHNHNAVPAWDVTPHLWDPANPSVFTRLPLPGWDIFCSGHSLLADGRLLVAGGHINDFVGAVTAGIYDPSTNSWTSLPNMNAGRWYPSVTILANGDALVLAGTRAGYGDINPIPQVWQAKSGTWRNLTGAELGTIPVWPDFYPYAYLAPNGKVFVAGPQQTARYLDTSGTGLWTDVANSNLSYVDYGSSVMFDDGKVLMAGGNPRDLDPNVPINLPSAIAQVINLNSMSPEWRNVAPMSAGRRHLNTTILPDGKVLVTGGTSAPGHDDPAGAVFFAELWDPETETWTILAGHVRYRGYHSNALLLPDGRVLVAGGGHPDPPGGVAENNAEIYSPPYLFKGPRPTITTAPSVVTYGQTFSVLTPDAASVTKVNWIRLPSVTHAFNENQRINRLSFSQTANGLNVTAPSNSNLCPPGHYMLFVLNSNGVPSVSRIVQIVDSTVQFSANSYSINEGQSAATITVNRIGTTSEAVMIQYATSNGTASSGADYVTNSGTLTLNSGETSKTLTIPILDDSVFEGAETVNLTLSNPSGVTLGQPNSAVLTIEDNEIQSALSINDVSAIEGDNGTTNATFTIALNPASAKTVSVNCVTADGTAQGGSDYLPVSTTLTFNPGDTSKSIIVPINGDIETEPDETFFVNLSTAANATISDNQGMATVVSDDNPPPGAPMLLTEEGSLRAIALDSVTMIREPLPILTPFNFSSDHRTRVMLFATNVDLMPGEPASVLTAQAKDSQNRIYPLTVEFVGKVTGFDWLTQIIVKIPEELTSTGDVTVSISLRGVPSNKVLLGIKSAANGPSAKTLQKGSSTTQPSNFVRDIWTRWWWSSLPQ